MSKQEALFLGSLGVSGFIIGWLIGAICGLPYFLMSFGAPALPCLGSLLFLWCLFTPKTIQDVLTYGFILILGLGMGASSANFANPIPQETCERN